MRRDLPRNDHRAVVRGSGGKRSPRFEGSSYMRKGRRLWLATFLLASPLLAGCQSVGSYFQDRVLDFVDIFGAKVVAGKGMKFGVEIGNGFTATEYEDFF